MLLSREKNRKKKEKLIVNEFQKYDLWIKSLDAQRITLGLSSINQFVCPRLISPSMNKWDYSLFLVFGILDKSIIAHVSPYFVYKTSEYTFFGYIENK